MENQRLSNKWSAVEKRRETAAIRWEDIKRIRRNLKIGQKVTVKMNHRAGDPRSTGESVYYLDGIIIKKCISYYVVQFAGKSGATWNECFLYVDLILEDVVKLGGLK